MLDPRKNHTAMHEKLVTTIKSVLNSGQYIMGKQVEALECTLKWRFNIRYALCVSSGTDALILSLMAHDVGPGDEVICPAFTFFATAGAIARVGAKPVFADIEPETFNIDVDHVKTLITPQTKAIIPVHLFGQSANMTKLLGISDDFGILIIEDCCQAIGAHFYDPNIHPEPIAVGGIGDVGCFSFFPSKNLGGFGEGGLVTTNDYDLYAKMKQLRVHGQSNQYYHDYVGGNFRMDEIQAACISAIYDEWQYTYQRKRNEHAMIYQDKLTGIDGLILPVDSTGFHVWNQYTIRVPDKRDELRQYLTDNGIATGIYYPLSLHQQPCFTKYVPEGLSLPVSEQACKECLSLPVAPELTDLQINYTALQIKAFMKGI